MYNTIYGLILAAAAINGFGASILWVAGLKYLSECANDDNKGLYNSIFWGFFMCS
jgi:MFS family permease